MNGKTRDERLRRMLREADPADGEAGLTTEEVRAMRRTVLTAIPERKRRFALSPVLAGAAVAVLVAIVVLMTWPRSESTMPPPSETSKVAVEKSPPPPRQGMNARATEGVPSGTSQNLVPPGEKGVKRTRRPRHTHAKEPDRLAQQDEPRARQIQFSTSGGTRVIWILTSDKAL